MARDKGAAGEAGGAGPAVAGQAFTSTGIEGLDSILKGGFPTGELHLVHGRAGTGKTTLAMQFLRAGMAAGEPVLYLTTSQTAKELARIAHSHGWSLDGMVVHELPLSGLGGELASPDQSVLHTADLELGEFIGAIRRVIENTAPRRVVLDSMGPIRMLTGSPARYHHEIVRLRDILVAVGATSLLLADEAGEPGIYTDTPLHALATSAIHLDQILPEYGSVRRRILVQKVRGVPFDDGYHNFEIHTGGLDVYPRLAPDYTHEYTDFQTVSSGIPTLDELLGGGLEHGTACLVVGPPGVGKSTMASLFALHGAALGTKASIFLFDERSETYKARAKAVGNDMGAAMEAGTLTILQPSLARISGGAFAQQVRQAVDAGTRIVIIDSLTGYFTAMGDTPMLAIQLHELLTFLSRRGVLTLLVVAQEGFMSVGSQDQVDVSYLSDTILVMRTFEAEGKVRRCLAAIKKRQGEHETTIRELFIQPGRVHLGHKPLSQFHSLLGGDPSSHGPSSR